MGANVDELLPLSRRLDWRFLLPDPNLNRVLYSGPAGTHLQHALTRFSKEIVYDIGAQADLAVLVNPSLKAFRQSLPGTKAFYIELNRPTWSQRLLYLASPGNFIRSAIKSGFEAEAYWHYPDFEAATRLIPLSVASPLIHVINKNRRDTKTRLKSSGMTWLLKSGILARSVSCLSIVGHKA